MNIQSRVNAKPFIINTTALFGIQLASYILPFLVTPYLTRTLGVKVFGVAAFGLSMIQLACMFTDYGFNLSATHAISSNRDDKFFINQTISAVFVNKIILLLLIIGAVIIYTYNQQRYLEYRQYLLLLIIPIIGQTFQPFWLFQGVEKMVNISIYTILSRLLYIGSILLFVKSTADLHWVAISSGIANLAAAIIGIIMIYRIGYKPIWPGWKFTANTFKKSTDFFWSRAALASFTSGGSFFLGLFSSNQQVAFYSAAEQIYKGAQSLLAPVSQALFPHMIHHKNFKLYFNVLKASLLLSISGAIIGHYFAIPIIDIIFGKGFEESAPIFKIFLIAFVVNTPSVLLGYPFLGALGQTKLANRSVVIAGALQILLLCYCYFTGHIEAFYIACTVLLVEIIVLVLRIHWSRILYRNYPK